MEAGETGSAEYTSNGIAKHIGYAPIPETNGWSIAVTAYSSDYTIHCLKGLLVLAIICAASAVVGGIIAGLISRKIGKPIKLCAERIESSPRAILQVLYLWLNHTMKSRYSQSLPQR